jgi:hypothetical protein
LKGTRRGRRTFITGAELDRWARAKGLAVGDDAPDANEVLDLARELLLEARKQRKKQEVA